MKKCMKRFWAVFLIMALCLFPIPVHAQNNASLETIKGYFEEGEYWNGEFDTAWECHGWALYATYLAYGEHAKYDWNKVHDPTDLSKIKPGDIVSFYRRSDHNPNRTHTVIITEVRSDCFITAECNNDYLHPHLVHYGGQYPKDFYNGDNMFGVEYIWYAPYALSSSSSSGAAEYYSVGEQVKVTANGGLNVRSGPGSEYSKIGKIPNGKIVTVTSYPLRRGSNAYEWQYCPEYNGYVATKWLKHISGSIYPEGSFKLVPKCAPNSAIAVEGRSYRPGVAVWLWDLHNDEGCQTWSFVPVQADGTTGEIYYAIINKRSGLALDVNTETFRLIQYDVHYGDNQLFRLKPVGDGYYRIESKLGYSVDIQSGGSANRTSVMLWYNDNSDSAQLFRLEKQ